jgi:hypothetical protein
MDRLAISELAEAQAVYREAPKPKRNTLRAGLIMLTVAILAGLIFFGLFLYYQHSFASPQQPIYIERGAHYITYPPTRSEVAKRFGGNPSDWYREGDSGWVYAGETAITFRYGKNVTLYTDHAAFSWE